MLLYAVSGDDHGETSGAPIVGSDGCSSGSYLKQLFPRYLRYRDNSIASQIAIYTIRWLQTTIDTMISFVFRLDLSKVFSEQFDIMCAQNQKRWAQHFFLMPHLTSIDKHMTSTTANEELDNLITTR